MSSGLFFVLVWVFLQIKLPIHQQWWKSFLLHAKHVYKRSASAVMNSVSCPDPNPPYIPDTRAECLSWDPDGHFHMKTSSDFWLCVSWLAFLAMSWANNTPHSWTYHRSNSLESKGKYRSSGQAFNVQVCSVYSDNDQLMICFASYNLNVFGISVLDC